MKTTATDLRANLYSYLDRVLETGEPLEIERKGRRLMIVAATRPSRLERIARRDTLACDPDDIVHIDWSGEWRPEGSDSNAS